MRRSPLVVITAVLALTALAGCSDDEKPETPAAGPASAAPDASAGAPSEEPVERPTEEPAPEAINPFGISVTGFGPYQVEETQADLVADEVVTDLKDAGGCTVGTGSALFGKPEVFFAGGKLVMVSTTSVTAKTSTGVGVGSAFTDAQAQFPEGKLLSGAQGARGWQVVQESNALLFEAGGDKVTSVSSGVSTSVEKNFTTGTGC